MGHFYPAQRHAFWQLALADRRRVRIKLDITMAVRIDRNNEGIQDYAGTLRAIIREYLFISLFRACAESLASENASRLAAMERADKNIYELLEMFHRIRHAGIDEELFDVIAGFEAFSK